MPCHAGKLLGVKLLYKPFGLIAGMVSARVGKAVFRAIWSRIDAADPPAPNVAGAPLGKVVAAQAIEAATMAASSAAVQRASMRTFHHLTGIWPGEAATVLVEE